MLSLHHDQAGSTRLLTGSTGTVEGAYTYDAYGNKTGSTGTSTTPLGYDAQYASSDTGLIYLRARVYDPSTAQFISVNPLVGTMRAPYNYAGDNPLNEADPTGRDLLGEIGNFLEPLNPVKYYEEEIESYENGCGYLASVAHGLEGAVVGALDASGLGEEGLAAEEGSTAIEDALAGLKAGNNPEVYVVDSPEKLQQVYEELSRGGNLSPARIQDRRFSFQMGRAWEYEKRPRAAAPPMTSTVVNTGFTWLNEPITAQRAAR